MIPKIGFGTFVSPAFKANIRIQTGRDYKITIDDKTVNDIERQFKQIGDNKDYFDHSYGFNGDKSYHYIEYYRENDKKKRVRFKLNDDYYLTPPEALKILTKAIMAKEPITTQNSNNKNSIVHFPKIPDFKDLNVKYSKQHSKGEDNFYYKNGKKAVCVKNITPYKGMAEYYDKNGTLQFKKYKTRYVTLTEKYNKDGQVSYRIIADKFGKCPPIVIKDDKTFQMYAYKIDNSTYYDRYYGMTIHTPDYRILIERNNNKPLRYYLDSTETGIRPKDASSFEYYSLNCRNEYAEKQNKEYAKELMKINPLYTPEHLKELYLIPNNFTKEFIEDNTIFNTNYRIDLIDNRLKPNTEKFGYKSSLYSSTGENYNYETINTTAYGHSRYIEEFKIPYDCNILSKFKFMDELFNTNFYRLLVSFNN